MTSPGCAHCGTPDCEALFHACLALDFTDPDYGVVHHLLVGAYMLQHDIYEHGIRTAMIEFVLQHLDRPPSAEAMRRIRATADGAVRVRQRTADQPPAASTPTAPDLHRVTVADVDTESAEDYRRNVRIWAEAVARHG